MNSRADKLEELAAAIEVDPHSMESLKAGIAAMEDVIQEMRDLVDEFVRMETDQRQITAFKRSFRILRIFHDEVMARLCEMTPAAETDELIGDLFKRLRERKGR